MSIASLITARQTAADAEKSDQGREQSTGQTSQRVRKIDIYPIVPDLKQDLDGFDENVR